MTKETLEGKDFSNAGARFEHMLYCTWYLCSELTHQLFSPANDDFKLNRRELNLFCVVEPEGLEVTVKPGSVILVQNRFRSMKVHILMRTSIQEHDHCSKFLCVESTYGTENLNLGFSPKT